MAGPAKRKAATEAAKPLSSASTRSAASTSSKKMKTSEKGKVLPFKIFEAHAKVHQNHSCKAEY